MCLAGIKEGTEIIVESEQEIFEKLGLPYLPVRLPVSELRCPGA